MIDDSTQYIARISHGKDSLKMLQVIKSRGLPLDRITTTDVWATDTISARLPPMEEFVARMDQKIWDMYHIEVEHLCAQNPDGTKKTYEQMFYHIPKRKNAGGGGTVTGNNPRIPGSLEQVVPSWTQTECLCTDCKERLPDSLPIPNTTGVKSSRLCRIQGFPAQISPWCRKLKIDKVKTPFYNERPTRRKDRNIVEYLGIAADEPARFGQLNARKRAPLVEFDIDEDLCGLYCQYAGMLGPTYETSCRDGCWFCHNQGVDQLRLLRRNYPELWALLMKWDLDSPISFKADGHTVHDFDRRFQMEEECKVPIGRSFRWAMLESPPRFVATVGDQISIF